MRRPVAGGLGYEDFLVEKMEKQTVGVYRQKDPVVTSENIPGN